MDPGNVRVSDKDTKSLHPIFIKDPKEWMKLVNRLVQVTTEDGQEHTGYVYTVDPVSESIALINHTDPDSIPNISSDLAIKLLLGASVTNVKIISDTQEEVKQNFDRLFRPAVEEALSPEELKARQLTLKSWLEKNRLPVTVGGYDGQSLTIAEALTIRPPYLEENCLSSNEIILSRIQGLIKNMPKDHETW